MEIIIYTIPTCPWSDKLRKWLKKDAKKERIVSGSEDWSQKTGPDARKQLVSPKL